MSDFSPIVVPRPASGERSLLVAAGRQKHIRLFSACWTSSPSFGNSPAIVIRIQSRGSGNTARDGIWTRPCGQAASSCYITSIPHTPRKIESTLTGVVNLANATTVGARLLVERGWTWRPKHLVPIKLAVMIGQVILARVSVCRPILRELHLQIRLTNPSPPM